jgi:hypothetical protein
VNPVLQIGQPIFQSFLVLPPRYAVHSGRRILFQCVKTRPQPFDRHVMQQCGEPFPLPFPRHFAHTRQSLGNASARPVPGACGSDWCSPWLASFPAPSPPLRPVAPWPCSRGSLVLRRHPTPHRRSCRSYGFRLLRPDCALLAQPTMRSPGSRAYSFSACAGSTTTRDHPPTRVCAGVCAAFPICPQGRRPELDFRSSIPCPLIPLSTLRRAPRGAPRKTGGQVVRYSFPVGLFHSLLHAGLTRRTDSTLNS